MNYPHNIEAERALLGLILNEPACLTREASDFDHRWLWRPDHQALLKFLRHIRQQGREIDLITLPQDLQRAGLAERCGGLPYVLELPDAAPPAAGASAYIDQIRECYARRETMRACEAILRAAEREDLEQMRETVHSRLRTALAAGEDAGSSVSYRELATAFDAEIAAIEDARASGEVHKGALVSAGYPVLNDALGGGMRRGSVYVLAARPGGGKTALMLEIARAMGLEALTDAGMEKRPEHALILSIEMENDELIGRSAARESGVSHQRITNADMRQDEWARYFDGIEAIKNLPIRVWHRPSPTPAQVIARIHAEAAQRPLRLVALDYLTMVRLTGHLRYDQLVGQFVRDLKAACSEVGAALLLLSQLNRSGAKGDGPPRMHDLKESGDIEQEAHAIMILDRPALRGFEVSDQELHIHIVKNRGGVTGVLGGTFYGARMQVEIHGDLAADDPTLTAPRKKHGSVGDDGIPF